MTQKEKILLQFSDKKNVNVEFATIYDNLKGSISEANKEVTEALELTNRAAKLAKTSLDKNRTLIKELDKAESLIKELGLDSEMKKVQTAKQQVNDNIKTINSIINNLLSV